MSRLKLLFMFHIGLISYDMLFKTKQINFKSYHSKMEMMSFQKEALDTVGHLIKKMSE